MSFQLRNEHFFLEQDDKLVPVLKLGFFVKIKEDENFNHKNTWSILRINLPKFGGELKCERDAENG